MKISIIIPNYNSEKTILKTLSCIFSQACPIAEVLVVDDDSNDDALKLIRKRHPTVKIIKNSINHGAGYTRNIGIANSTGDFLLFIDSDVVVSQDTITKLLEKSSSADIVFPKISYENGMSMYPNTKNDEKYLLISPIFLISRKALNKLHGSYFDDQYTGYCEDVDFFLKCKLLGLTCQYVPEAIAVHVVNKPKDREARYYSEVVSTIYGAIKYYGYEGINHLDHSFKIKNILKLYVLGIFNFKLFDAQIRNYDKAGSTLYKIRYMLSQKERISSKGGFYLFFITIKGIIVAISNIGISLRSRKKLRKELKENSELRILDISYGARTDKYEAANTHTFSLAKNLGVKTALLLITSGRVKSLVKEKQYDHLILPLKKYPDNSSIIKVIKTIFSNNFMFIRELFSIKKIDVVYERMSFSLFGGAIHAWLNGIPLIYEINGIPDEELFLLYGINNKVLRHVINRIFKIQLNMASCIIVQSEELRSILIQRFGLVNVQIVENGTEKNHSLSHVRQDKKIVLVYVGVLDELHDLSEIFAAIHKLKNDFIFYVVGEGSRKEKYEKTYEQDARFAFTGQIPHEQAKEHINMADICIASYSSEYPLFKKYGFYLCPIKILEYLAYGKPTIIFGTSNILLKKFELQQGISLATDIGAFENKLQALIESEKIRESMGTNAKRIASENTWDHSAQKTYLILKQCT